MSGRDSQSPLPTEDQKRCGVPWCRSDAYPGSEWCQFHEVVNPFDDTGENEEPLHPERAVTEESGA